MANSLPDTVDQAPSFSEAEAAGMAETLFAFRGTARALPSERDQNFRVTTENGDERVLKIAGPLESREVLELQNLALQRIHDRRAEPFPEPCPRVCETAGGERIVTVVGKQGESHHVRLLTWLPGTPLALVKPHSPALLRNLGNFFGSLDLALAGFDHPAAHRDFYWDLVNAGRIVGELAARIEDRADRLIVEGLLARFESEVAPRLPGLPSGVIHADGNDHNVLARHQGPGSLHVSGVIDFGDMLHGCRVFEPAIVIAYAMLGKADPLAAATHVAAGYHATNPLDDEELSVLWGLAAMRLCMSVCIAARQRRQAPDNEYLRVSERPAWELLRRLDSIHPRFAEYALREGCGRPACPKGQALAGRLDDCRDRIGPLIEADLTPGNTVLLDLGVDSTELAGVDPGDTSALTQSIFGRMRTAGAAVGIGRYDEARLVYDLSRFVTETDESPERRTIHLGLDLFVEPGTAILAPLDGWVQSCRNNDEPLDYGPTIILRHGEDDPFFTLYGHLDESSLLGLEPDQPVKRGQRIATVGAPPGNGGWPPHLHFQLIADLLGNDQGNYPGVAEPRRREVWKSICPDPNLLVGLAPDQVSLPRLDRREILSHRGRHLSPSLSTSYDRPLQIVRGRGQQLFDEAGRAYLDCVNNVCHVGHCHPRVVRAGQDQLALLNTNTRYLHENLARYVRRLAGTMPDPLSVCFLVCSGSEANELALRLARAYTGKRDVITTDGAYHGNTQALIDISPYKFDGPGGAGAPDWVHRVPMPDGYRGPHRGNDAEAGSSYARHVAAAAESLAQSGHGLSAFICESLLGCGGQIVPPPGFLLEAFDHVRQAGGVCIADEVQVGFGRAGSHFWAFDAQGAVPDIVTLGKPIGNGHPMAAVVTTPEIADSFANGMEYFNTFGGNPVSCAIGLAVLDVIEDEGLQQNAHAVGARLKSGLETLASRHPLIGDVRGLGLFVGVELVLDRETLEPAPRHAARVTERLKDHGILVSTDGPLHNVLKIKPPLVFTAEDSDRLVDTLNEILAEDDLAIWTD